MSNQPRPHRRSEIVFLWVLLLVCHGCIGSFFWNSVRRFYPGNWMGDQGMLPGLAAFYALCLFLLIGIALSLFWGRPWFALGMLLSVVPCLFPSQMRPDPMSRARAELPEYTRAISNHQVFGDQYEEEINGRKLVFWRWAAWGIDDAIGVIYDPTDKLTTKDSGFRDQGKGSLYTVERISKGYFLVWFS